MTAGKTKNVVMTTKNHLVLSQEREVSLIKKSFFYISEPPLHDKMKLEDVFYFWAFGSRNQCPRLQLAGPEEAVGRGTHQAREDGWLQRLKLTVCANSSSGEPHVPSISLLTRRCKKPHNSFVIYNLFIHRHTRMQTSNENTNRDEKKKHTIRQSSCSLPCPSAFSQM